MSSNKSKPLVPDRPVTDASPNYADIVRFLIEPLLEAKDSLKIDCEISGDPAKVWVRVAFAGEERGRVFGRGGRNIQAIRTVLQATAAVAGHVAHLDVYGGAPNEADEHRSRPSGRSSGSNSRRPRPNRSRQREG
ncbi:MAG: KH domain-containing protein [Leptolyngbya sp.]|nr:KH domain-containing protein [Leptolyngbya sp.]